MTEVIITSGTEIEAPAETFTVETWGPAGNAQRVNPVSLPRGGASGGYGAKTYTGQTIGTPFACQIGAGGSQNDTWFDTPTTVCGAAALNNGTAGTSNAGDVAYPGADADLFGPAFWPCGSGAAGPHGPGAMCSDQETGGNADGGLVAGGYQAAGVDFPDGGSGAGRKLTNGQGNPGGFPGGGPSAGKGTFAASGVPAGGQIRITY